MSSLLNQKAEGHLWGYSVALMGVLLLLLQGQPKGPQGEHTTALTRSSVLSEGQARH